MLLGRSDSTRIPWLQLGIEALLVVLSVLLALALNSWRQSANNEDLAQQAVRTIQAEVMANREEVRERLAYHESLLDSLKSRPQQGIALRAAFVQNDAWDTAQATQASAHLDFDVAAQASRIHGLQTAYVDVFLTSAVMTIYQGENPGRQSASRAIVQDMIGIERQLLDEYDTLLDRIGPSPSR